MSSLGWNNKYQAWDTFDIDQAVDNGASVVNMSWVGSAWSPPYAYPPFLRDLIIYALLQNVPCVAAAGNDQPGGPTVAYPAAFCFAADTGQVIAVSATDSQDHFVDGWNYSLGTDPINDPINSYIDVTAPGYGVLTTDGNPNTTNGYLTNYGTSFSAPHVSALCALISSPHRKTGLRYRNIYR
jgi:subtilisin family serine protease